MLKTGLEGGCSRPCHRHPIALGIYSPPVQEEGIESSYARIRAGPLLPHYYAPAEYSEMIFSASK